MRSFFAKLAVACAALAAVAPGAAVAGDASKPTLAVRLDHKSKDSVRIHIRNDSGIDMARVRLSLSLLKTNGVALESAVVVNDLPANGKSVPTTIRLPGGADGASIAKVEIIDASARTSENGKLKPDVQLEYAH